MVAAKDYFFAPQKKKQWLSRVMHLLPIERHPARSSMKQHLDLCRQFIQEKKGVLIFYPEGTRSRNGQLQRLKKGAVQYAYELGVPLVPAYIEGTFQALPKGKRWPRPKKISVSIGTPIFVREAGLAAWRNHTQQLREQILQLRDSDE